MNAAVHLDVPINAPVTCSTHTCVSLSLAHMVSPPALTHPPRRQQAQAQAREAERCIAKADHARQQYQALHGNPSFEQEESVSKAQMHRCRVQEGSEALSGTEQTHRSGWGRGWGYTGVKVWDCCALFDNVSKGEGDTPWGVN